MALEKQIKDLDYIAETVTGSHPLHTVEGGLYDVIMTVQDVLDLVPSPTGDPGALGAALDPVNDSVVVADNSASNVIRRLALSTFLSQAGVSAPTYTLANPGSYNHGAFQMRFGTVTSNSSGNQFFAYESPFTTATLLVLVTREGDDISFVMGRGSTTPTEAGFTINRNGDIGGSTDVSYLAIGY